MADSLDEDIEKGLVADVPAANDDEISAAPAPATDDPVNDVDNDDKKTKKDDSDDDDDDDSDDDWN